MTGVAPSDLTFRPANFSYDFVHQQIKVSVRLEAYNDLSIVQFCQIRIIVYSIEQFL